MVLLGGSRATAASKAEKMQENFALSRLSMCDAIRITEGQTGGKVYKAELKRKDDRVYYELEFVLGGQTVKTQVDALVAVAPPAAVRQAPNVPPPSPRPLPPPPARRSAPRPPAEEPTPRPEPIQPQMMPPPGQREQAPAPSQPQAPALPPSGIVIPFDTESVGATPAGFTAVQTNPADKPVSWKIVADETAPSRPNAVAVAENANESSTFSLLVANQPVLADVDTSVKVNVTGGSDGNSAGLAWRYQDPNDYYVAAYNKAENTLDVWRVKDGRRKRIGTGVAESDAAAGAWREIRVEMKRERITAYLDGRKLVSERDFTFAEPGKVGFWAGGDTTAEFDDLTVAEPGAGASARR